MMAGQQFKFNASTRSIGCIIQLIKAVSLKDKDTASFVILEKGISVYVEDSKYFQAVSYLRKEFFDDYQLSDGRNCSFGVSLSALLNSLSTLTDTNLNETQTNNNSSSDNDITLQMLYKGYGHPLILRLADSENTSECQIKTKASSEMILFNLGAADVVNKIILSSEILKEIWEDMNLNEPDVVTVTTSPVEPFFQLSTASPSIDDSYEVEKISADVFECKATQVHMYKMQLCKYIDRAIGQSAKVSVQTNKDGLICFQFMLKLHESLPSFVEFYCLPNVE